VPGHLTIRSERCGVSHVVGMAGELDLATAPRLQEELQLVEASDAREIILDLSDLDFMDSTGLQLIIRADARSKAIGKRLKLLRGQAHVHRVFEITATVDRLPFAD
jgi:anti-sigma B factor antagonist